MMKAVDVANVKRSWGQRLVPQSPLSMENRITPKIVVDSQNNQGVRADGAARNTKMVMGRTDAKPKIAADTMSPALVLLKARLGT
jgi:hypothetical protein